MPAGNLSPQVTDATVQEEKEDEVLAEVSTLANKVMSQVHLVGGQEGEQPLEKRIDDPGGVVPGEGIGRKHKNTASPKQGGPPGAKEDEEG